MAIVRIDRAHAIRLIDAAMQDALAASGVAFFPRSGVVPDADVRAWCMPQQAGTQRTRRSGPSNDDAPDRARLTYELLVMVRADDSESGQGRLRARAIDTAVQRVVAALDSDGMRDIDDRGPGKTQHVLRLREIADADIGAAGGDDGTPESYGATVTATYDVDRVSGDSVFDGLG